VWIGCCCGFGGSDSEEAEIEVGEMGDSLELGISSKLLFSEMIELFSELVTSDILGIFFFYLAILKDG
jgi:hypothetical protein